MDRTNGSSVLLDRFGRPFVDDSPTNGKATDGGGGERRAFAKFLTSSASRYLQGLTGLSASPEYRARDPVSNHPWVYASAATAAVVISQAPLTVWREADEEMERRAVRAKRLGRVAHENAWTPARGLRRGALRRHCSTIPKRMWLKGLEPDSRHEFAQLMVAPNPLQDGGQLVQMTAMNLALGECFWVLYRGGVPAVGDEMPDEVWPVPGDYMKPRHATQSGGAFLGWKFSPPTWHPDYQPGREMPLEPESVVQFKMPGPSDPVRGFNPLTAAAAAIESDMMIRALNRALIRNDGTPRSVLYHPDKLTEEEEEEVLAEWAEKFEGSHNAGKTAHLFGGAKLEKAAWSPRDLEFENQGGRNRDEELAVMRTPPSALGMADLMNYATQLGQDKNYWQRMVMPLARAIEGPVDRRFFFSQPDTVFAAFDVSGVEALRAGISDMIADANVMCGQNLHTPPRVAFQVVGLDVPEYDADEVAFVPALATPAGDAAEGLPDVGESDGEDSGVDGTSPPDEEVDDRAASLLRASGPLILTEAGRRRKAANRWRQFVRMEAAVEIRLRKAYRGWVNAERRACLVRFDEAARGEKAVFLPSLVVPARKVLDMTAVLPDLDELIRALRMKSRPIMAAGMEAVWDFTEAEIGVPTFSIDDDVFVRRFDAYEARLVEKTPEALAKNVRRALEEGIGNGETVAEIRLRLAQVFNTAASSSKTLLVARTSTGGFMNATRDGMFREAGFKTGEWVSAGDENTRVDHLIFGDAGEQKLGFNYQTIAEESTDGTLEYPGDLRAPFGTIANCRCMWAPTE